MEFYLILILVNVGCVVRCTRLMNISGYYGWVDGNRTELFCPNECGNDAYPDQCCSCNARRCWDIIPDECPMSSVHIEYMDMYGNGRIVASNNATYATLKHINGKLTTVPDNICSFSESLVILDLRGNRLTNVSSLRGLHKLDTLRLDNNRITEIDNTTFSKMSDLRILSVKNNLIKRLCPNLFQLNYGNILFVDFSENKHIEVVDITNILRPGPFCKVNYSSSTLEQITNDNHYTMTHAIHGPGDIFMEHTQIGSFLNFSTVGVTDYAELSKYHEGSIHIDESSVLCDCSLYPLVSDMADLERFWPNIDGDGFHCESPESMKGKDITKAYKDGNFDELTCDISENPDCPHYLCHCIEQPSLNKIIVNCTGLGFKDMPENMPVGSWNLQNIDLILAKNKITAIPYRNYLHRLVNLDLSGNVIENFDERAAETLNATLNFEDQNLANNLPVGISRNNPALYTFGDTPVVCDCSNLWIGDWIRLNKERGILHCSVDDIVIPSEDVDDTFLECYASTRLTWLLHVIIPVVVGLAMLLLMLFVLCAKYRYEIMLLRRKLLRKHNSVSPSTGLYDVFISFYTDNSEVLSSVRRYLKPELQKAGYSIFVPCIDVLSGNRDHEMMNAVDMSRNFVVVLCSNYADDYDTLCEFDTIWKSFLRDKSKHIIIINFDNLDPGSVNDRRLIALQRVYYCLDFTNTSSRLISRLMCIIGDPVSRNDIECEDHVEAQQNYDNDDNEIKDGEKYNKTKLQSNNVFSRLATSKSGACDFQHQVYYPRNQVFDELYPKTRVSINY